MARLVARLFVAAVVAAVSAVAGAETGRPAVFRLPRLARYDIPAVCSQLQPSFRCISVFDNAAYGGTDMSLIDLQQRVASIVRTNVSVGYDVLQDVRTGTLHSQTVMPRPHNADVALSYRPFRRLAQLGQPTTVAFEQVFAPYHLSFLNAKQRMICQVYGNTRCMFKDGSYVYQNTGVGTRLYTIADQLNVDHVEFLSRSSPGRTRIGNESFMFSEYVEFSQFPCTEWQSTHITAVAAGLVYGPAKDAEIVSVGVKPGCRMTGTARALAEGLQWVKEHAVRYPARSVALVSGSVPVRQVNPAAVELIDDLVLDLLDMQIVVVTGSGAESVDACEFTPGRVPGVMTVSAAEIVALPTKTTGVPWAETNYGACIDIWAPGAFIESASSPANDATAVYSGSLQAAALVAGIGLTLLERYPTASPATINERIINASSSDFLISAAVGTVDVILQGVIA